MVLVDLEVEHEILLYFRSLSWSPRMNRYTRVKIARWIVFLLSLSTRDVLRIAHTMWEDYPVHPNPGLTLESRTLVDGVTRIRKRIPKRRVVAVVWILQSIVMDWVQQPSLRDERRKLHLLLLGYTFRDSRVLQYLWYEHY